MFKMISSKLLYINYITKEVALGQFEMVKGLEWLLRVSGSLLQRQKMFA